METASARKEIETDQRTIDKYLLPQLLARPMNILCAAVLLHFSLSVKAVTLIFISGRDLAISSTHEGKTGNINGKTENFNCLLRVNKYKLDSLNKRIRSVLDKYTTFKFKHCEFNPQQGRLIFLFKRIIYFYFF